MHLDKLKDEYADKGLTVVAVTDEPRARVETFVSDTGATHAIVIESTDSMRAYGRTSFPSAFLIDPMGRILWVGNPGGLSDSKVEEALENTKILPDFPKALASARKAFDKNKFGDALKKTEKSLAGTSLSEADRAAGDGIKTWLDWYAASSVENAGKDLEAGRVYAAWATYEMIARGYKGLDIAKRAAALGKELLADKGQKKEIDAGKKLAKIKLSLADLSAKKAIKALTPLTARKYADTRAGRAAATMIKELQK